VRILAPLLERLTDRHPDLRLIVAGDGPLRHELAAELESRGLARRAILTGAIAHEELPGLIRGFDVALAPYSASDHDFYFSPLKVFEYMACGVPTVATELGQIGEVIRHGETGLLYAADDLDSLSTACETLLSDRSLRERLGQAAAKYVLSHHTWEKNADRVMGIAETAIARGGRP
jgi:glycosyltransferase involved in cell wall biosynthesis